jgi:hypothetical protein
VASSSDDGFDDYVDAVPIEGREKGELILVGTNGTERR